MIISHQRLYYHIVIIIVNYDDQNWYVRWKQPWVLHGCMISFSLQAIFYLDNSLLICLKNLPLVIQRIASTLWGSPKSTKETEKSRLDNQRTCLPSTSLHGKSTWYKLNSSKTIKNHQYPWKNYPLSSIISYHPLKSPNRGGLLHLKPGERAEMRRWGIAKWLVPAFFQHFIRFVRDAIDTCAKG